MSFFDVNVTNKTRGNKLRVQVNPVATPDDSAAAQGADIVTTQWFTDEASVPCGLNQVVTLELRDQPPACSIVWIQIDDLDCYTVHVSQLESYKKWTIVFKDPLIKSESTNVNVTVGEDEGATNFQSLMRLISAVLAGVTIGWVLSPLVKSIDPGLWKAVPVITGIGALISGFLGWIKKQ
jgi:hypothetical protein